jgi:hypothetical protein
MPEHKPLADGRDATPAPSRSGTGDLGANWPEELTNRIDGLVGTVRDRTTVPVTKAARAVVFGLIVVIGAALALLLLVVALVRLVDVYLPVHPYARRVWIVDAALGAIFLAAGTFCWSKRTRRSP